MRLMTAFRHPRWFEGWYAAFALLWTILTSFSNDSPWRRDALRYVLLPYAPIWIWAGLAVCLFHVWALWRDDGELRVAAMAVSLGFWAHLMLGVVGALIVDWLKVHQLPDVPILLTPTIALPLLAYAMTYRLAAGLEE